MGSWRRLEVFKTSHVSDLAKVLIREVMTKGEPDISKAKHDSTLSQSLSKGRLTVQNVHWLITKLSGRGCRYWIQWGIEALENVSPKVIKETKSRWSCIHSRQQQQPKQQKSGILNEMFPYKSWAFEYLVPSCWLFIEEWEVWPLGSRFEVSKDLLNFELSLPARCLWMKMWVLSCYPSIMLDRLPAAMLPTVAVMDSYPSRTRSLK